MSDAPKINPGQPLSLVIDGKETLLYPDEHGNTYVSFGDGTAGVHVAPGDNWTLITDTLEGDAA